jgi:predicted TIM-barrel fold metal-dependent hydrolase
MKIEPVIDAHIHVQPWEQMHTSVRERMFRGRPELQQVLEYSKDPKLLLEHLDAEGVEKAVLVNYVAPEVMGFTDKTNTWICDFVRGHEDRLIAMGSVHPRHTNDAAADVARLADMGIRALKVHPPHQLVQSNAYIDGDKQQAQLYEAAQKLRLPIMVHTGTSIFPGARNRFADPMGIDDVACDFPELQIILAHGGRPLYMDTVVFLMRRHANVWMDVSGVPPKRLLDYFPRIEMLADKVLWGTDWPSPGVRSLSGNLADFLALPLTAEAQDKVLRSNARRIFNLEPR